jgi:hypothetical protein
LPQQISPFAQLRQFLLSGEPITPPLNVNTAHLWPGIWPQRTWRTC